MEFKIGDTLQAIADWPPWPRAGANPVRILEGKEYKIKHITKSHSVLIDDETGSDMRMGEDEVFNYFTLNGVSKTDAYDYAMGIV